VRAAAPAEVIARDWRLDVDVDQVLRGEGADAARVRADRPRLLALAQRALAEGMELLVPRVAWRRLAIASVRRERVVLENGGELTGTLPARHLACARQAAVLVVTIGGRLEARVSNFLRSDLPRALALDGFGSAAVESLAAAACRHVGEVAGGQGMRATVPVSPGMTGWPTGAGQREIFGLLDGISPGVRLTAADVMVPHKSLSMILGLGRDVEAGGRTCDHCGSGETCRFRDHDAAAPA
jgi:hypothetical protein